jgi:bifunctional DNA-binding transcriptional regulator/antitoxin component of YhaV-PrlF toxin-antitoxin module
MPHVIHTKVGQGRRIAIPADLCHEYGLEPGTPVVLEASESGIMVRPLSTVIREVQDYFLKAIPPEVMLSEELIQERRADAAQEDGD